MTLSRENGSASRSIGGGGRDEGAAAPVAVVTGATGGIGRWIARGLAVAGQRVVLVGRDPGRLAAAQDWIAGAVPDAITEAVCADLSLLAETRRAAGEIVARHPRLAVLVNNAGMFAARAERTAEGQDRLLATNLLSPFLLSLGLLPALRAGANHSRAPARIVHVGSSSADRIGLDPALIRPGTHWAMGGGYARSKLALTMVGFELAERLAGTGVVVNVVHPGLVATGIVRSGGVIGLAWRIIGQWALTPEQGAVTPLHAALTPEFGTLSGRYVKSSREAAPNPLARDGAVRRAVWQATERLAGPI